ncbi:MULTISPECIES: cation-translocating P-type ATPase [Allobacillus]|uniref:Cd(2+)-exporting ATPase n=1 Tax=Allobacillus salarius TaxID=1955272 RepID=A0A556PDJ4_9BACI|nr:heavy metal translocating P-type ATPase [Allobacillus salarius]TSJ62443.1 cadmium-translocating P-type ATPase [Allobacillus salarius]
MVRWIQRQTNQLTFTAGALLIIAFIAHWIGIVAVKQGALIVATIVAGVPIAIKAFQALRMKAFSIELLVTIAVTAALFIGEYVESAAVTFLFLFGAYLEARTLNKTRASLRELTELAPDEASVFRNGDWVSVSVDEVEEGERVVVRSGGKIPVDGKILTGEATINEAAITGESVPVGKTNDDDVFSGSIIDSGYIEMVAEKVGEDTTFAKIIELVEEAQESKSKTQRFLDKFANIYTPSVVVLSVLVYLITRDLHLAIIFLVIACPGALVIGAPVSNVAGIGNGAKRGVLIKGGDVMDRLSKIDTIVFDKTGTLTRGKPEVTDFHVISDDNPNDLLQMIAQAEMASEHHLGKTIVKHARAKGLSLQNDYEYAEVVKGNGLRNRVAGHQFSIGNRMLMEMDGVKLTDEVNNYAIEQEKKGNTAIFAAKNGQLVAIISIADQIREDAIDALKELREHGIKQMIMLTGDNAHTAKRVADQLGLDGYHAEQLPVDKVKFVEKLQNEGHKVAMIGDGINDAPSIAKADIGLAMGEGGTDVSMETADVVLMADKLKQFSHAYALAKVTVRNMKQNMAFAVGTVFLLLLGVLAGSIHLASGMFIHEASILVVILNGMRLIRFNREPSEKKIKTVPAHA